MAESIETTGGRVRGVERAGVVAFFGIPYAEAPSGSLRFRAPVPRTPWEGILDATSYGPAFPQAGMGGPLGPLAHPTTGFDVDALRLNVWAPAGAAGRPVLVFIHGGAWVGGSGSDPVYDGTTFAADGVVAVTVNYRLGAEGFLYLADRFEDYPDSGNLGVLDQLAALRWVQDNIAAFGGDPANVTLAGESAGAMTISMLVAAKAAQGLFRRAICQSGAIQGLPVETASMIAGLALDRLGITPGDTEALGAVPVERLIEVQDVIYNECGQTRDPARFGEAVKSSMPFQPVYGTELFPDDPLTALERGGSRDVEILAGTNTDEMLILLSGMRDIFNTEQVTSSLDSLMSPQGRTGEGALEVYRASRPEASVMEIASAIETDRMMRIPTVRLAEKHAASGGTVFLYDFDWCSNAHPADEAGSHHFLEIPFVFHTLAAPESVAYTGDGAPVELADLVHDAWVAFVTGGSPETAALSTWPRYTADHRYVMKLSTTPELLEDPLAPERELWHGVL